MQNKIQKLRAARGEGGFTLVELLIVIVVLGILAGITVFGVAQFKQDATVSACKASAKTVTVAAQAYNAQNASYPTTVGAMVTGKYLDSDPTVVAGSGVTYDATTGKASCSL